MLAYSIKPILELVPEAYEFVKKASVDREYPLDNPDSCIASALELKYHEHVDGKPVDLFAMDKVAQAIDLYGVREHVERLSSVMIKAAEYQTRARAFDAKEDYLTKQASFEGELCGFVDYTEIAGKAERLYKQASELGVEPSESVLRYSGNAYLNKEAALEALAARFEATHNANFVKIAGAIGRLKEVSIKPQTVKDIAVTVAGMDKEAGLSAKGFDFYREALIVKEAALGSAMTVKLCGKDVPYESLERVGRDRISQYIGEDVAKEMDRGPMNAKQVFETLPLDLQKILVNLIQNV